MNNERASIYQLKITLEGVHPQVWRRVQVPADLWLDQLHQVIQIAMGWSNSYLHAFTVGQAQYSDLSEEEDLHELGMEDEHRMCLFQVIAKPGQKLSYEYDFGDDWQHTIILEKVLSPALHKQYPLCLDGKRACPPEDCGGVSGYESLLRILKNPAHRNFQEWKAWVGREYDPERWDRENVYEQLQQVQVGAFRLFS